MGEKEREGRERGDREGENGETRRERVAEKL